MIYAVRLRIGAVPEAQVPALAERLAKAHLQAGGEALPRGARALDRRPADPGQGLPVRMSVLLHVGAGPVSSGASRVNAVQALDSFLDRLDAAVGDAAWLEIDAHLCNHDEPVSEAPGAGLPPPCEAWQPARRRGSRG